MNSDDTQSPDAAPRDHIEPMPDPRAAADFPVLPLRDVVVFPHMVVPLGVGRPASVRAVQQAKQADELLVLVAQRNPEVDDPSADQLYEVGCLARVVQTLGLPDSSVRVIVEGQARVRIERFSQEHPYLRAVVEIHTEEEPAGPEVEARMRRLVSTFQEIGNLSDDVPPEAVVTALNVEQPGRLCDLVGAYVGIRLPQKQELLGILSVRQRLLRLDEMLVSELEILRLQRDIQQRVRVGLEASQREYFLREQLRAIQDELGDFSSSPEYQEYHQKIDQSHMSAEATEKAWEELTRLERMPPASPEVSVIRTYLDWLIELPWEAETSDKLDVAAAQHILDQDHYGLKRVKERVLEFLAVRQLVKDVRGPILCFIGPPGVGKTSIGRSIARAMGREFIRVSLGGVRDEAEIRGHRRTYVGAMPGRIIQTIRRVKSRNPVFMIDEIDKIGADFRGDPTSALLEVLDPEQNTAFVDHYLEVPFDLSRVMFIATGNLLEPVPPALKDRMEVIEFAGYIEEEKLEIARRYLVPKQRKGHGVNGKQVRFSVGGLRYLIRHYTHEAGVRNLEREIATVCRKVARQVAAGEDVALGVSEKTLPEVLGPVRFRLDERRETDQVGVATGLAFTQAGGDIISIEVSVVPGEGALVLTGQLGEVMRESAQAAVGYARSQADAIGLDPGFFTKHDIHVHVPSGAVPKEGPSAGVAIATALLSALRRAPVRSDVAMTGEVTLHGRVLPIGGVREKILAAHRAGIRTVILPIGNEKDVAGSDDIPATARQDLTFVYARNMAEVVERSLVVVE
jgi:ATP-dependent Lon protease